MYDTLRKDAENHCKISKILIHSNTIVKIV